MARRTTLPKLLEGLGIDESVPRRMKSNSMLFPGFVRGDERYGFRDLFRIAFVDRFLKCRFDATTDEIRHALGAFDKLGDHRRADLDEMCTFRFFLKGRKVLVFNGDVTNTDPDMRQFFWPGEVAETVSRLLGRKSPATAV